MKPCFQRRLMIQSPMNVAMPRLKRARISPSQKLLLHRNLSSMKGLRNGITVRLNQRELLTICLLFLPIFFHRYFPPIFISKRFRVVILVGSEKSIERNISNQILPFVVFDSSRLNFFD